MPKGHGSKALTCRVCGMSYIGHPLTKECENCRYQKCANPVCQNKIVRPKNGKQYCSDACRQTKVCRECGNPYVGQHKTTECEDCRYKECQRSDCLNKINRHRRNRYCSAACREQDPYAKKRATRVLVQCPCGREFPKYGENARGGGRGIKYCSSECRTKYHKTGSAWKDPEWAKEHGKRISQAKKGRPNLGLRGYKQTDQHLIKRLGNGSIRASQEELSLLPTLVKLGFRHTGEGSFWRRWPDGTIHNPDFVNEDKRVIIEYFGSYWHEPEEAEYAQQQWKAIGYDCLIVWDYEREVFLAAPAISFPSTRIP